VAANRTKFQRFREEIGRRVSLAAPRPRTQLHLANDEYYSKVMAAAMSRVKAIGSPLRWH